MVDAVNCHQYRELLWAVVTRLLACLDNAPDYTDHLSVRADHLSPGALLEVKLRPNRH